MPLQSKTKCQPATAYCPATFEVTAFKLSIAEADLCDVIVIGDKVGLQSNFDMLAEDKNTPKQNHNYTVNHSIFPIAQPRIQIKGNPLDNNPNKRQRDEVTDNLTLQLLKNNLLIRLK